jgi:hypothetical protein
METKIFWKFHERNDRKVAKAVREGNVDTITGTGWGFLDRFFYFLYSIKFFKITDIKSSGYKRIMLPLVTLITTYSVKILLGISSMNKIPNLLFREVSLLSMIGFTATQIQNGCCKRGKGRSVPINKNTLARMLERLSLSEVNEILCQTVAVLASKGFISGSTFIIDATDIKTTDKCDGAGKKKVKKKKYSKLKKQWVETEEIIYGFKLIVIWERNSHIIVAAKVVKIADHESKHTLQLISQAKRNIGAKNISLLLIDNGFMDGKTLWNIKHKMGIDFIVRIRTNMALASDARSFRESPFAAVGKDKERGLEVLGVSSLTTYDQYGSQDHINNRYKKSFSPNKINAVMVTCWDKIKYGPGHEKIFATSLDVEAPLNIVDNYSLRSLIENSLFRELKQGWNLEKIPMKKKSAVVAHAMLTVIMYSLNACFQTELGKKLTNRGIRRIRDEDLSSIHKLIVFSGNYFAIFDVEEYALIVRAPPKVFFRIDPDEAKKRLGL